MHMNLKYGVPAVLALLAVFAAPAAEAQQTRELNVSATVPEACVINSPAVIPLDFGVVYPTVAADSTASAQFLYRCSQGTDLTIELDLGDDPGATLAKRIMVGANTADSLLYRLEKDDGSDWGDLASGFAFTDTASGFGTLESVTINGVITQADAQQAEVDSYSDTVTITLLP